jgi:hypothetical protein
MGGKTYTILSINYMKYKFYQDLQIFFETLIYSSYINKEQGKIFRLHQVQYNFRVVYYLYCLREWIFAL